MKINAKIWEKTKDALRKITLDTDDIDAKEMALDALLAMTAYEGEAPLIEGIEFDRDIYEQIVEYMRQGNKIQAIKLVQENSGLGLKESKELVEKYSFTLLIPMKNGYKDGNPDK